MKLSKIGIGAMIVAAGGGVLWLISHCNHKFTRPFSNTPWRRKQTYVVCIKCGGEYEYDAELMEVGKRLPNIVDSAPKHTVI